MHYVIEFAVILAIMIAVFYFLGDESRRLERLGRSIRFALPCAALLCALNYKEEIAAWLIGWFV